MKIRLISFVLCAGLMALLSVPAGAAMEATGAPAFDDKPAQKKVQKQLIKIEEPAKPKGKASLGVYIEDADGNVRITGVVKGGPAEKAGARADDLILTLNKQRIDSIDRLVEVMSGVNPGDKLAVLVKRGEEKVHLKVKTDATNTVFSEEEMKAFQEEHGHPHEHGEEEALHGFFKELLKSGHPHEHGQKAGDEEEFIFKSDDGSVTVLKKPGKQGKKIERKMQIDLEDLKKEHHGKFDHHGKKVTTQSKRIKIPGGEAYVDIKIVMDGDEECDFDFDYDFDFGVCPHEGHDVECDEEHEIFMFKGDGDVDFFPFHGDLHGFEWHAKDDCHGCPENDCKSKCSKTSQCKTDSSCKSKCGCKGIGSHHGWSHGNTQCFGQDGGVKIIIINGGNDGRGSSCSCNSHHASHPKVLKFHHQGHGCSSGCNMKCSQKSCNDKSGPKVWHQKVEKKDCGCGPHSAKARKKGCKSW